MRVVTQFRVSKSVAQKKKKFPFLYRNRNVIHFSETGRRSLNVFVTDSKRSISILSSLLAFKLYLHNLFVITLTHCYNLNESTNKHFPTTLTRNYASRRVQKFSITIIRIIL